MYSPPLGRRDPLACIPLLLGEGTPSHVFPSSWEEGLGVEEKSSFTY